jgi:HK97 family phage portal protein
MFEWLTRKEIPHPVYDIKTAMDIALKSLPLPQTNPQWKLFGQRNKDWLAEVAIKEGYNASSVVYACVEKRAKLIASVPWVVMQKRGDKWEAVPNHPLQKLLENPNSDQSLYELMYSLSQSLDLTGDTYISEIKGGSAGLPVELWHLPSKFIKIGAGKERLIDFYKYEGDGINKRIDAADMIHIRMPNPNSPFFGMPVLMAAGQATDIDREAGIFQKVSLQNRGLSDIAIKLPDGATPEQAQQVQDALAKRQTGAANARKPIVSTGEVTMLAQTAAEMDFVNSRKAVWAEIAAVFGVPLASLGFTENVNLANAKEMNRALWQDTIIPQLELIKRQMNHQLASEFGKDIKLSYDLSNVTALQEDLDKKLANAQMLWGMGVPFNVINQELELGFDDIEGGNTGYLPTGVLPVGYESDMLDAIPDPIAAKNLAYGD